MANSVKVYTRTGQGIGRVSYLLATVLGSRLCSVSTKSAFFRSNLESLTGIPGDLDVLLGPTDLLEFGDPGTLEETALERFEYEISLEFRGVIEERTEEFLRSLGSLVFPKMTETNLAMVYAGDGDTVYDLFVPGRGIRSISPPADIYDEAFRQKITSVLTEYQEDLGKPTGTLDGNCRIYAAGRRVVLEPVTRGGTESTGSPLVGFMAEHVDEAIVGQLATAILERSAVVQAPASIPFEDVILSFLQVTREQFVDRVSCFLIQATDQEMKITSQILRLGEEGLFAPKSGSPHKLLYRSPTPDTETELGEVVRKILLRQAPKTP